MAEKKDLMLLFERPQEPVFLPKGKDKVIFDVPDHFLTERYRSVGNELTNRFKEEANKHIPVKDIIIPDLRLPMSLGRFEQFSLFIPSHRVIAGSLVEIFMSSKSIDDLQSIAVYARDRINPYLFNYALSVALLHRPDTKGLNLPSFVETFPDKFIDSKVFSRILEESTVIPQGSRIPIIIPRDYTASSLDEEHRLWYFREDMGLNLHHWHWHLVYPFEASRAIVTKDRRGELFYYMHQQIIARYNMERLSNNLLRVQRFSNLREPLREGYFPKMDSAVASRSWPPRFANTSLQDLNREAEQLRVNVSDLEIWRDRFNEVIKQGYAIDEGGKKILLDETTGINTLGNIMESSVISPNRQFYGDLHNMGHVCISYSHDPDHRHLESFSVMGDSATAMRDPAFYRWHSYIDDMFQEYKFGLNPYNEKQLGFNDIMVTGIELQSDGVEPNLFHTFWQQSDINLSSGMNFFPSGDIFARFTHLQHTPFTYNINVSNSGSSTTKGTVRIFLGPKFDGANQEMMFTDHRRIMCEMDKFMIELHPGENKIRRRSSESNVTVPFERTFRNISTAHPIGGTPDELEFNFCGCGWPNHMLVPKGRTDGLQCQLFVMVSNYEDDKIDQDRVGQCSDASSYCGIRDRLYPDKRPMGFPFDRLAKPGVDKLKDFITSNMRIIDVTIKHTDTTTVRQQ